MPAKGHKKTPCPSAYPRTEPGVHRRLPPFSGGKPRDTRRPSLVAGRTSIRGGRYSGLGIIIRLPIFPEAFAPVTIVWRRTLPLQRRDRRGLAPLSLLSCRRIGRHPIVSGCLAGRSNSIIAWRQVLSSMCRVFSLTLIAVRAPPAFSGRARPPAQGRARAAARTPRAWRASSGAPPQAPPRFGTPPRGCRRRSGGRR